MAIARKRTRKKPATKPNNPPPLLDPHEAQLDDLLVELQTLRRRFRSVAARDGLFERALRVLESFRFRQLTGLPISRTVLRRFDAVLNACLLEGRYDEQSYALSPPLWLPVARAGKGGSRSGALRRLTDDVTHAMAWIGREDPQRAQQQARRLATQLCERACELGLRLDDADYEESPVLDRKAFGELVSRLARGQRSARSLTLDVLAAVGHSRRDLKDWHWR